MAEYKAKLLRGLFTRAKNVVFSDNKNLENKYIYRAISANTTETFTIDLSKAYLLAVGNPNRTAAQSCVYVVTGSTDLMVLNSSANITVTLNDTTLSVASSVNSAIHLMEF